ncbi:hypothetical protein [Candidatus Manganitrophus noduliformans]|uniref:Exodeoxyribonuclease X-like C-terminal domain-containing protein n=1 Tax=Candidatus Manganitrophus noduliformans TaxID=2606439 RepID=A0A7X6I9N7_9BACT|nr:hypothetical protein [Candidatus Manganitrophus noduliformans]NKE69866.1 hypothetical protein [Candidatus Manganitrophus noduliformans]
MSEVEELTCSRCGAIFSELKAKLALSGPHVKASCPECGGYVKFISQGGDPMLWFGKYRGKKLTDVVANDRQYLEWLVCQHIQPSLRKKIKGVLRGVSGRG